MINFRQYSQFKAPPRAPSQEDGLLLIDKPAGPSSHDIVGDIRRKFGFQKVGHGGTLDPGATGLLLILIGKGTSLSNQVMGCDKKYIGEMLVGTETDSQDLEGEIVSELPYDLVSHERIIQEASKLTGDIYQVPPMASALKRNGVPLYKLARKGETVEREPRLVHVYNFKIPAYEAPIATFEVLCVKGTYIRTLCHDVGQALGCGACMKSLRRTQCGKFNVEDALTLDAAKALTKEELIRRIIPMHLV